MDQFLAGQRRQVRVLRPGERMVAPRVCDAQQRAHVCQQAQRVPIGEGASNIGEQIWLGRRVLPTPGQYAEPGGGASPRGDAGSSSTWAPPYCESYAPAAYGASLSLSGTMRGKRG